MKDAVFNALIAPFFLATMASLPAHANDTLAVLGAGGLEFTTSADIVMVSENLYLSPSEVRVRYAFHNESHQDVTTTVAFPLPDLDPHLNADLPGRDQHNFVDFKVTVDGQPIQPGLEEKAIAENDVDVTSELAKAGLPVNANLPGWQEKIRTLPDDVRRRLIKQGLLNYVEGEPGRSDSDALWKLRATFHWDQTFPAGKTVIVEHRYKPIVGAVIVYSNEQLLRQSREYWSREYCLDEQGVAGASRLLKQAQAGVPDAEHSVGINTLEVSYILTTGANWKGPIGDFHLTIDKENPKAVLSLCTSGLKNIGPTTFGLERTNFVPKEDIRFVIFGDGS